MSSRIIFTRDMDRDAVMKKRNQVCFKDEIKTTHLPNHLVPYCWSTMVASPSRAAAQRLGRPAKSCPFRSHPSVCHLETSTVGCWTTHSPGWPVRISPASGPEGRKGGVCGKYNVNSCLYHKKNLFLE